MYKFVDTIEASEGTLLPSEALSINGDYIENLIEGYRTLNVAGREALSPELNYYETGARDGSVLQGKRFPARILTVKYQLIAKSNEAFRNAYNQLNSILNVENAELIFNDETDKFFIGTPETISEVEPGLNSVIGEFTIFCADPFKYSVEEYEAIPTVDDGSILIDYNGTYKAYPILEADFYSEDETSEDGETATALTGSGDCGYIAFFNENEKIIQIGDPAEEDTESYAKSQTLINQRFDKSSGWNIAAQDLWTKNNGKATPSTLVQEGILKIKAASYESGVNPETSGTLLTTKSTADSPTVNYKITAKAYDRTATSTKVKITITTSLRAKTSYIKNGAIFDGSVKIGGKWYDVKLKKSTENWVGNSGHVKTLTVTVKDLTASTTVIEDIKFKVTRGDTKGDAGKLDETSCNSLKICAYDAPTASSYYLTPSDYGSTSGKWHGVNILRTIPIDAAGDTGAKNFTLTYKQKMCIGKKDADLKQLGSFQVYLLDSNNALVACVRIHKNKVGKKAELIIETKNTIDKRNIDLSYNNKYFGNNKGSNKAIVVASKIQSVASAMNVNVKASAYKTVKTSSIIKSAGKFTFNIGGFKLTVNDAALKNVAVSKICFTFAAYSNKPQLEHNGLYYVKFVKNNCDTFEDIPNKFSANDVVEADCGSGEIYLNGTLEPSYGALGNDWEDFYLTPGLNQIGFSFSDWVAAEFAPEFKVRYREVFL